MSQEELAYRNNVSAILSNLDFATFKKITKDLIQHKSPKIKNEWVQLFNQYNLPKKENHYLVEDYDGNIKVLYYRKEVMHSTYWLSVVRVWKMIDGL